MKAEIYINKMEGAQEGKLVRIDVRAGAILLSRVEMPIADFADALMGLGAVTVEFTERK